jgi:hypothetical protein
MQISTRNPKNNAKMRVLATWRPCIYHVCINHDSFLRERNGLLMRTSRLKDLKSPAVLLTPHPGAGVFGLGASMI